MQKRIEEIAKYITGFGCGIQPSWDGCGDCDGLKDGDKCAAALEVAEIIAALYEPKPDENRLLNDEELDKLAEEYPCLDFSFEDDYKEEVTIMRQAQRDLTARIVAEEMAKELENLFEPTVPMSLDYEKWQTFKARRGIK